jgi:hypothetical protein
LAIQRSILDEHNAIQSQIQRSVAHIHQEISLAKELRERLIADAVTGKIDLRSIPLEPTEESPEEDLCDISENGFDSDADIGAEEDELLEEAANAN